MLLFLGVLFFLTEGTGKKRAAILKLQLPKFFIFLNFVFFFLFIWRDSNLIYNFRPLQ